MAKDVPSNVFEHIPVLAEYAEKCTSTAELGVQDMVTTWAFLKGLRFNHKKKKYHVCMDLVGPPRRFDFMNTLATKNRITLEFVKGDSGTTSLPSKVDLLYIDTLHHYAQLRRELEKHASSVKKYIIMHNTEIDAKHGEIVRMCYYYDAADIAQRFGFKVPDMCKGLKPAIDEFLAAHPEWKVDKVLPNNNGLTILARSEDAPAAK